MLSKLIIASISTKVCQRISNKDSAISIGGTQVGTLIYKLIMNKTIIDTQATSAAFRRDLMHLDAFMATCNSNIELFNNHVNIATSGLEVRGEKIDDLITHHFTRYKIANDVKFVAFIDLQKSSYLQGSDLTRELLMTNSLNNCNTKIIQIDWGAQSEEQRQIVALSVELRTVKDSNIELSQSILKTIKKTPSNTTQNRRTDASWKSERGTGPKTKVVDGVTNHWCDYHKRWNLHKTEDCKAKKAASAKSNRYSNDSTSSDSGNVDNTVSYTANFSATMAAICEEEGVAEQCGEQE